MKIYCGEVSNVHKALMWRNLKDLAPIDFLNRDSVVADWSGHEGMFVDTTNKLPQPDITMLIPGFAFRSRLSELVFPRPPVDIEFLPFGVEGEGWVFANSLRSTSAYDPGASTFMRSINGQIIFIFKLVVTDSALKNSEVFTISDSNRAVPIFTEPFVRRLEKAEVNRMNFKEIGEIL